VYFWQHDTVF